MPEGDTLFRTAQSLRPALSGKRIVSATSRDRQLATEQLCDARINCVETRGKHLLIHSDRAIVHSHLGMTGSWHIYPAGHPWRKPARQAALVLSTDTACDVVCFTPKTLELLSSTQLKRHYWLSRLGPDILAPDLDLDAIVARFEPHAATPLGVGLLNQSIVCGIGNVYKSELLFLRRLDPFRPLGDLDETTLKQLIVATRRLMQQNLSGYPRTTRFGRDGQRKWVYGRHSQPCFKCGQLIAMRRQGDLGRSTYYCRTCQK